jgi:hypothetical protein
VEKTSEAAPVGTLKQGHASVAKYIRDTLFRKEVELKWVPAHPERKEEDMSKWGIDDMGIYIADQIAGGSTADEGILEVVDFKEAYRGHNSMAHWFLAGEEGPLLMPLGDLLSEVRRERYLVERDRLRGVAGRPPEWTELTIRYAAKVWRKMNLTSEFQGLAGTARSTRLIFDKGWHGGNEGKGTGEGEPLPCTRCGEPDGLDHWVLDCQDDYLKDARDDARGRAVAYFSKHLSGGEKWAPSKEYRALATELKKAFLEEASGRMWCGLWTPAQLERFDGLYHALGEKERKIAMGMFEDAGAVLASAVSDLWEARKDQPEFDPDEGKYAQERRDMRKFTKSRSGVGETVIRTVGAKRTSPRSGWKVILGQNTMDDYVLPRPVPAEAPTQGGRLPRFGLSKPRGDRAPSAVVPAKGHVKSGPYYVVYGDGRVEVEKAMREVAGGPVGDFDVEDGPEDLPEPEREPDVEFALGGYITVHGVINRGLKRGRGDLPGD